MGPFVDHEQQVPGPNRVITSAKRQAPSNTEPLKRNGLTEIESESLSKRQRSIITMTSIKAVQAKLFNMLEGHQAYSREGIPKKTSTRRQYRNRELITIECWESQYQ